jgi:hypothetical protein
MHGTLHGTADRIQQFTCAYTEMESSSTVGLCGSHGKRLQKTPRRGNARPVSGSLHDYSEGFAGEDDDAACMEAPAIDPLSLIPSFLAAGPAEPAEPADLEAQEEVEEQQAASEGEVREAEQGMLQGEGSSQRGGQEPSPEPDGRLPEEAGRAPASAIEEGLVALTGCSQEAAEAATAEAPQREEGVDTLEAEPGLAAVPGDAVHLCKELGEPVRPVESPSAMVQPACVAEGEEHANEDVEMANAAEQQEQQQQQQAKGPRPVRQMAADELLQQQQQQGQEEEQQQQAAAVNEQQAEQQLQYPGEHMQPAIATLPVAEPAAACSRSNLQLVFVTRAEMTKLVEVEQVIRGGLGWAGCAGAAQCLPACLLAPP